MILAAGYGTRLRPLTNYVPKPLLPVWGKPMIHYVIEALKKNGIEEIVINLHYRGEMIEQNLKKGEKFGIKIHYTHEPEILGTGGGIKNAEKYLAGAPFLVINTDILVDFNLEEFWNFHKRKGGIATLILRNADLDKYNNILVDTDSRIIDIAGRPWKISAGKRGTFAGIHILEPRIFQELPSGKSSITDCYVKLIERGVGIYGFFVNIPWYDLGNLDDYEKINREFNAGKLKM